MIRTTTYINVATWTNTGKSMPNKVRLVTATGGLAFVKVSTTDSWFCIVINRDLRYIQLVVCR